MMPDLRDHGGGLDAAIRRYGGSRAGWLDLSTGINPLAYPIGDLPDDAWTALPDAAAMQALLDAAHRFWNVPESADILAAPGASCLIAQMPRLSGTPDRVQITTPTYNEHAAAFAVHGWTVTDARAPVRVVVHPNNPTGAFWDGNGVHDLLIIDESFGDIAPDQSLMARVNDGRTVVLKSFGKFWGLAGLRLGFAIGAPELIRKLRAWLGPWPVSGPALHVGAKALADAVWADATRERLAHDAARLDDIMAAAGADLVGGTPLFRLYRVDDAAAWQDRLAQGHVWSRIFPYSDRWLRLGLPHPDRWTQLETAVAACGTAGGARSLATSGDPAAR